MFILDNNDNSGNDVLFSTLFEIFFFFLYLCSSSVFISFSIHVINFLLLFLLLKSSFVNNKFASYVLFIRRKSEPICWKWVHTQIYCKYFPFIQKQNFIWIYRNRYLSKLHIQLNTTKKYIAEKVKLTRVYVVLFSLFLNCNFISNSIFIQYQRNETYWI